MNKLAKILLPVSIIGFVTGAIIISNMSEPIEYTQDSHSVTEKESKNPPIVDTAPKPTLEEVTAPTEPVATPQEVIAPKPVEAPKTVQEPKTPVDYAKEYLDLSGMNMQCFNSIVERYPSHFTNDNMEQNVKALRAFVSVCASGIMSPNGHIINMERSGKTFFETEMAQRAIAE